MLGLFLGIAALIAAGILIAYAVIVTIKWLVNKIKEKIRQKKNSKVAVGDLQAMVDSCQNTASVAELDKLVDEGYTHVMADVDRNGQVSDIEVIKDTSDGMDEQVDQFINRTGEGLVVVSG